MSIPKRLLNNQTKSTYASTQRHFGIQKRLLNNQPSLWLGITHLNKHHPDSQRHFVEQLYYLSKHNLYHNLQTDFAAAAAAVVPSSLPTQKKEQCFVDPRLLLNLRVTASETA
ncbi:hypothetical protein QQ045_032421 [Rhodiola kirilowii]